MLLCLVIIASVCETYATKCLLEQYLVPAPPSFARNLSYQVNLSSSGNSMDELVHQDLLDHWAYLLLNSGEISTLWQITLSMREFTECGKKVAGYPWVFRKRWQWLCVVLCTPEPLCIFTLVGGPILLITMLWDKLGRFDTNETLEVGLEPLTYMTELIK